MAALPNSFAGYKRHIQDALKGSTEAARVEEGKPVAKVSGGYFASVQPSRGRKLFSLPKEPEDAQITGGTRSLDRRLLALNLRTMPVR